MRGRVDMGISAQSTVKAAELIGIAQALLMAIKKGEAIKAITISTDN
jgi:hypothetical protein